MEKVRVGIIGNSWWTDMMYGPSLLSHDRAELVAICGRDGERTREVADKFGARRVFTDYRELASSGEIDAVFVVTPDDLHKEMTLAAIASDLHVFCDKPMANNAADAGAMRDAAMAAGIKHMVMFTWRWHPIWRFVKRLLDKGYVGRCRRVRLQFRVPSSAPGQWRFNAARANSVTADLGSHMIDMAQWWLAPVVEVDAHLQTLRPRERDIPDPANDAAFLTLRLADGTMVEVDVSATGSVGDRGATISAELQGDAGTIEARQILFGPEAGVAVRGVGAGGTGFEDLSIPADLMAGLDAGDVLSPFKHQSVGPRAFIDAIIKDIRPEPDFAVGAQVQEVVDAALRSHLAGQRIRL